MPPSPGSSPPALDARGWRAALGNSLWLFFEKAGRWAVALTVGVWVARSLGPHDFGAYNAALAWAALFAGAAGLGLESIVVRELVRRPLEQLTVLATAVGLRCAGGIVTAALAILAALAWPDGAPPVGLVAIAAIASLLSLGEVFDLWFQARLEARTAALARLAVFAAAAGGRVLLILHGAPVAAFLWLAAGEALVISVVLGLLVLLPRTGPGRAAFSFAMARELLRESWPNIIANLAGMAYLRADRVLLGALSGDAAVGVFSAAASLVEAWYVLPMTVMNSLTPLLTRLHAENLVRFRAELARLARLQAGLAWLLGLALAGSAPWVVPWLFGAPYAAAAPVLMLLAGCLPFVFLGLAVVPWYLNERLTLLSMRRHLYGGCLNILLNLLLIPQLGALGAAVATVCAFALAHVFSNALDSKTRPIFHLQWRALWLRPPHP